MRRYVFIFPLVSFVALLGYFAVGLQRDPSIIPTVLINKPAPSFNLPAIEGYSKGFSSVEFEERVSLVNIFGSWCAACRIEHPLLLELAAVDEIPIYGIDWKDPPGAGAAWLARYGDPYTLIGDDADGRVSIEFGVTGAPETFIIDRNGHVVQHTIGPADWHSPEVIAFFEALLDAPALEPVSAAEANS